jgi:hypothetical protein
MEVHCMQLLYMQNLPLSLLARLGKLGKRFARACEKATRVDQWPWWCGCRIRPLSRLFTYWLAQHGSLLVANMRHLWFEI